jgi:hypothetical protein
LFSTYYYKISLEKNLAIVESLCVPIFKKENCFELKEYSRNITSQKHDFEQDVFNPSKKITKDRYQSQFDKAFRGLLKIKLNGSVVETPSLIAEIVSPKIRSNKN